MLFPNSKIERVCLDTFDRSKMRVVREWKVKAFYKKCKKV